MAGAAVIASLSLAVGAQGQSDDRREKPNLALKVTPAISFSPSRVYAVAELKGDPLPEDEARLYCAATEWDWGDGTRSENAQDCEPYEEGRSVLKRRFSAEHTYTTAGRYRVQLRLVRNNKTVMATNATVQVRPGVRDWGGQP